MLRGFIWEVWREWATAMQVNGASMKAIYDDLDLDLGLHALTQRPRLSSLWLMPETVDW